jgi:Na+/proline symporter
MVLESGKSMIEARCWYYLWFIAFYCMATGVGLLSRIFIPEAASFDAELALPSMALQLLPPVLVGLILAGIFAATISTADSLILSCSAAISHDLLAKKIESTNNIKLITLAVVLVALLISLFSKESVFSLVIFAWSGMASAFAPLLICLCLGLRPRQNVSIAAILCGLLGAITWRLLGLHNYVFEGVAGIAFGGVVLSLGVMRARRHS